MKPQFELADIIRRFKSDFISTNFPNDYHKGVLEQILYCRTSVLGGHRERCLDCGHERISYNSCRNRHCPKCQNTNREMWIQQTVDLLPSGNYFHVVFTLPDTLNPLFLSTYKDRMQNILFRTAWETVQLFAANPKYLGAQTGMIAILHTWGQTLTLHPHIHCIIPDSGLNYCSEWIKGKWVDKASAFLFPVLQMSRVFKGKFMSATSAMLKAQHQKAPTIKGTAFNVYAKKPFNGLEGVIEYLGRYTHKIAISNHRIEKVDEDGVTFRYKDYRQAGKQKTMCLSGTEFLRRFCLHIQNKGFRRIRYYGILATSNRVLLNEIRTSSGEKPVSKRDKKEIKKIVLEKVEYNPECCPVCKIGKMKMIAIIEARPPPNRRTIKTKTKTN